MGIEYVEDQKRKIVELALQAAKRRLSPQTQFIHFFPDDPFSMRQDTIPSAENFFYALSLFRSKLVENIQEAKFLLERLLPFEVKGNFPVFLHEYPICRDRELSAHLLPVFFYLLKDFSFAMGEGLQDKLESAVERSLISLALLQAKGQLSMTAEWKIKAYQGNFDPSCIRPRTPSEWAGYWTACQMMPSWPREAGEKLHEIWDFARGVFIGPSKERIQYKTEPAVTLFDLFMGEYSQRFTKRSLREHPCHLRASVIHPFPDSLKKIQGEHGPYQVLITPENRQSFTLYWGDDQETHSFVCEAKRGSFEIQKTEEGYFLRYLFDEQLPSEEEDVELAFYVNESQDRRITVNGARSTVFHLGDLISIQSSSLTLELILSKEDPEEQWIGHLSKANRSFQSYKENSYECFDWKIGLRTLHRKARSHLSIGLKIKTDL